MTTQQRTGPEAVAVGGCTAAGIPKAQRQRVLRARRPASTGGDRAVIAGSTSRNSGLDVG